MTQEFQIRRRVLTAAQRLRDESGYSLVELLATMLVVVTLAAFVLPFTRTTLNAMSLSSDARNLSGATALAKMRAAAYFTKARIYVDLTGGWFRVERWQKTGTPGWVTEGVTTNLSSTVSFGFMTLTTPPPNTQAEIAQAPSCRNDANVAIAGTACVVFNSRGVPIDEANSPTAGGAFYMSSDRTVYGITTGAGGLIQLWQNNVAVGNWTLK
jgi:Tfp pilus assembly protein FimT